MTQVELYAQLKTTGYQVAYHHFIVDSTHPAPVPPYIVYLRAYDTNISSDYAVHGKFKNYQVELYTSKKDLAAEQKIEAVLNSIDPDYTTSETYIEEEGLYQVIYQIKIDERS
jgi:hypothetical protein